jgi:hypothetical protein
LGKWGDNLEIMNIRKFSLLGVLAGVAVLSTYFSTTVFANHSWGVYHWARTGNPFTLKLGDNLSSNWDPYLAITSRDWSLSSVLHTTVVAGGTNPKNCRATNGRVEVCNSKYGNNGWLGLAQIWINGSHITQGVTKINDTYFNTTKYNTPAWKNLVMCQEVGHTLGLDHQDEIFNNPNLGTCMDYTDDPSGLLKSQLSNEHPNAHDYEELETIYAHLDSLTTVTQTKTGGANGNFENRSDWGKELKNNGKVAMYERDFGPGHKLVTFIILAQD